MLDRIRQRVRPAPPPVRGARGQVVRAKRVSRREREERQRRLLYVATAVAAALVIVVLAAGVTWQYWIFPRQTLASVNGKEIQRRDYWKVRGLQLRQQAANLNQQLSFATADQSPQLQQQIEQARSELSDIKGAPVAADTLSQMVDDKVVLQNAGDLGITVSDDEINAFIDQQFSPEPLTAPTPTPTIDATAAAWATGTTQAQGDQATQTAAADATTAAQTAIASGSPAASPTGDVSPTATAGPSATPAAAEGSPIAGSPAAGSPEAGGTPTLEPTATITAADALATSQSTFKIYKQNFLSPSGMSRSDYVRLVARPSVARQKAQDLLTSQVPARADQVRAAHILVATKDAADAVEARLRNGEDFAAVAKEVSTDTASAANGGDLGWFPKGVMVDQFQNAAFQLEPGQVSDPVQSKFGWHVIKVLEKEQNRPLTLSTLQSLRSNAFTKWLTDQRNASRINAKISLTNPADTSNTTFQAPPDAPQPPVPTPQPEPTQPIVVPEPTDSGTPAP